MRALRRARPGSALSSQCNRRPEQPDSEMTKGVENGQQVGRPKLLSRDIVSKAALGKRASALNDSGTSCRVTTLGNRWRLAYRSACAITTGGGHLIPFSSFHLLTVTSLPCLHAVAPLCRLPENVIAMPDFGLIATHRAHSKSRSPASPAAKCPTSRWTRPCRARCSNGSSSRTSSPCPSARRRCADR